MRFMVRSRNSTPMRIRSSGPASERRRTGGGTMGGTGLAIGHLPVSIRIRCWRRWNNRILRRSLIARISIRIGLLSVAVSRSVALQNLDDAGDDQQYWPRVAKTDDMN